MLRLWLMKVSMRPCKNFLSGLSPRNCSSWDTDFFVSFGRCVVELILLAWARSGAPLQRRIRTLRCGYYCGC